METTMRAVQFDQYGDKEVLYVTDRPMPAPNTDEVLVQIKSAGVNPGESGIRNGVMKDRFPADFPSGEGSDLAGIVLAVGSRVNDITVGEEVLGYSLKRSSHATHVVVPENQVIRKPSELTWEEAGSLYVAGCTAYAAVRAIDVQPGETVVVSAAAGGVGALVVQLLIMHGAQVVGIASVTHHDWLEAHQGKQIPYGDGLLERIQAAAPNGVDAFIDLYGPEYMDLAVTLGVPFERIETIISFHKAASLGTKSAGSGDATSQEVLSELANLIAAHAMELPIAATFHLDDIQQAFAMVEQRHTLGKVALIP